MDSTNRRNFYRLLQIQPDAPLSIIKSSYRTLLRKLRMHPDLGGDSASARDLNLAYSTLKSAPRRAAYDRELRQRYKIETLSRGQQPGNLTHQGSHRFAAGAENRRNYYRLLQVQPDASLAVIQACYQKLLSSSAAPQPLLTQAYRVLSEPGRRQQYDKQLLKRRSPQKAQAKPDTSLSLQPQSNRNTSNTSDPIAAADPCSSAQVTTQKPLNASTRCWFCKTSHVAARLNQEHCLRCGSPLFLLPGDELAQHISRSLARIDKIARLHIYTSWPGAQHAAILNNLSPQGLRLTTKHKLRQGQRVKINAQNFKAVGQVAYASRSFMLTSAGIQFYAVTFGQPIGNFISETI